MSDALRNHTMAYLLTIGHSKEIQHEAVIRSTCINARRVVEQHESRIAELEAENTRLRNAMEWILDQDELQWNHSVENGTWTFYDDEGCPIGEHKTPLEAVEAAIQVIIP